MWPGRQLDRRQRNEKKRNIVAPNRANCYRTFSCVLNILYWILLKVESLTTTQLLLLLYYISIT